MRKLEISNIAEMDSALMSKNRESRRTGREKETRSHAGFISRPEGTYRARRAYRAPQVHIAHSQEKLLSELITPDPAIDIAGLPSATRYLLASLASDIASLRYVLATLVRDMRLRREL